MITNSVPLTTHAQEANVLVSSIPAMMVYPVPLTPAKKEKMDMAIVIILLLLRVTLAAMD
jgi:hypothetical protein